ncbi:MAG TPA: tetratricopeptide repeat protein [Acidobacteriota bacterium]|nr:tetratricopeptide repeat protein [Acidobacteriota bacterium]
MRRTRIHFRTAVVILLLGVVVAGCALRLDRLFADVKKERRAGNFARADQLLRKEIAAEEEKLETDSLLLAKLRHELAVTHFEAGDLILAKVEAEAAMEIRRLVHPGYVNAENLITLGRIHERLGEMEAAEHYFRSAVEVYEILLPDDIPVVEKHGLIYPRSKGFEKLARAHIGLTRLADALEYYHRALVTVGDHAEALRVSNRRVEVCTLVPMRDDLPVIFALSDRARDNLALGDTSAASGDLEHGEGLFFTDPEESSSRRLYASLILASGWLSVEREDRAEACVYDAIKEVGGRLRAEDWKVVDSVAVCYGAGLRGRGLDAQADSLRQRLEPLQPKSRR